MATAKRICAHCNKAINDTCVMALGKCYHKEHFLCSHCKNPLKEGKYIEERGQPYCEADWKVLFQMPNLPKCAHCNAPIQDTVLTAMGKTWHKDHFVCTTCKKPFKNGKFFEENGKPYCEADFKAAKAGAQSQGASGNNPICAHCNKPITDTVLKALGKSWHKEHFQCAHCNNPIREQAFHEHEGKPYCDKDYNKLYGKRCSGCGEVIQDTILTALNKTWHKQCFTCDKCKKPIKGEDGFTENNGKPFCMTCT